MEGFFEIAAYFIIYSFLGWCAEVIYHVLKTGEFVNRGFLNGPVCPIYGFGMVLIVLCLDPVKDNFLLLFLGGAILTTILEGVTGFVLNKLFHTRWWDYSNCPFNLGGYVCLGASLVWGIACVFVVDLVHPAVARLVSFVPDLVLTIVTTVLLLCFAADLCVTVSSVMHLNRHLKHMEEISSQMFTLSEKIGGGLYQATIKVGDAAKKFEETSKDKREDMQNAKEERKNRLKAQQEKIAELVKANKQSTAKLVNEKEKMLEREYEQVSSEKLPKRLLRAFPNARSDRYGDSLEKLKEKIAASRKAKNKKPQ